MTPINKKLKEIYVDLWGPHNPPSLSDSSYAVIFLCEKSRKTRVLYLRSKDEFVDAFQIWLPRVKAELVCTIKAFCANGGGEFISIKLRTFCKKKRISIKYAAPYIHEENGLAERRWRIIVAIKDSLLLNSGLSLDFWAKVMYTANYLQNKLPTKSQRRKLILEEAWTSQTQDISHIRVFRSIACIEIPKEK